MAKCSIVLSLLVLTLVCRTGAQRGPPPPPGGPLRPLLFADYGERPSEAAGNHRNNEDRGDNPSTSYYDEDGEGPHHVDDYYGDEEEEGEGERGEGGGDYHHDGGEGEGGDADYYSGEESVLSEAIALPPNLAVLSRSRSPLVAASSHALVKVASTEVQDLDTAATGYGGGHKKGGKWQSGHHGSQGHKKRKVRHLFLRLG